MKIFVKILLMDNAVLRATNKTVRYMHENKYTVFAYIEIAQ